MKALLALTALALAVPTAALAGSVDISHFGAPSVNTPQFDSLGSDNITFPSSPYALGLATYSSSSGITVWGSGPDAGGGYPDCAGGCVTNQYSQDLSFELNKAYGAIGVYVGQATAYTLDVSFYDASSNLLGTIEVSNSNDGGGLSFVGWASGSGVESVSIYNPYSNEWDVAAANIYVSSGVPEPSTWAMMLLGFAGLGWASYRAAREPSRLIRA
jgi:PEP-CTERM motif